MLASEMLSHCGMGAWESNSRTVRASTADPLRQPFLLAPPSEQARLAPAHGRWTHEVSLARAPQPGSELVAYFSCRAGHQRSPSNCSHLAAAAAGFGLRRSRPAASDLPQRGGGGGGGLSSSMPLVDMDPTCMSWAASSNASWSDPVVVSPAQGVTIDTNAAAIINANGSVFGLWRDHNGIKLPKGQVSQESKTYARNIYIVAAHQLIWFVFVFSCRSHGRTPSEHLTGGIPQHMSGIRWTCSAQWMSQVH
jgi:hypothetical protein